jgi:gamma-glutamyltranspeptidase/glutathione hydrolase
MNNSQNIMIMGWLLCCLLVESTQGADRVTGKTFALRSPVLATQAMAATSQPLATQVALDVMRKGGNAVDAAIAANALLGLVEPTGNGIGGDLFAIVWDAKTKKLYGLNASGRSPKALSRQWFIDNNYEAIPSHGPLPVSVPGTVDGWFMLHERFGKMPMSDLLAPTIAYAEAGFPVSQLISYYWQRAVPILAKWPGFTDQFTLEGRAPAHGEIWKNPNLAMT